jgi:diguanylate cyclase (GGDEF)-like protein
VRIVAATPIRLQDGRQVPVTVSAGLATYPQDGASADSIVRVADTGLYQAKNTGRNRVCYTGEGVDMLQ